MQTYRARARRKEDWERAGEGESKTGREQEREGEENRRVNAIQCTGETRWQFNATLEREGETKQVNAGVRGREKPDE
jgi:hypothetical protein